MQINRNVYLRFFLLLATLTLDSSCLSHSLIQPASVEPLINSTITPLPILSENSDSRFNEMSCEKLIEKSQDQSFSLKGLAGLKAHKNCKNFKYDYKQQLTDLEKRIYSEEIDELDPKKPAPSASLSLAELKKNLKEATDSNDKFKAYKQLRSKLKSLGQRNDYLKTTADFFNWTKAEWKKNKKNTEAISHFYEATQIFARTYWTEDKHTQADKILTDTLRLLKGLTSVAEIYFIQGRMSEEEGHYEEAVTEYDLTLEDIKQYNPKNLSFNSDRVLWLKSWILYKNKKWTEAEKSFADLAKTAIENSDKTRAAFFQARCLNQLNKSDEAKKIFEKLTQDEFFGFYGLVSYYEMGKKIPALSQVKYEKKFNFDLALNFLNPTEKNIFTDLIKYQEVEIAERAVPILSKGLEKQVNLSLYLADKGKRYLPLFASFAKLSNDAKIEVLMKYPNLIYPQPHFEKVKMMSEKTQLPISLIYSIMKQESAFNEKTRSHADAIGLMQMIPRLAKQLSKKFDILYSKPEDLFNPLINIQLGSFELMEQVKKQSGQLTYVAAAYNAGPNALAGWLKTRKRNDIIEFIEEIPYDETRTYVKIIARNKLFYDRVSKQDEEQNFPTEFLNFPTQ